MDRDRPFLVSATDLVGRSGAYRTDTITGPIEIDMELERVEASHPVVVELRLEAMAEGVLARGTIEYSAELRCNRCLVEWIDSGEASFCQLFTREPDEDGRVLTSEGYLDLEPVIRDEVSLALPLVPLCREDCRGLCGTCGTDLNTAPCSGHADESESPFGALRQLLEP